MIHEIEIIQVLYPYPYVYSIIILFSMLHHFEIIYIFDKMNYIIIIIIINSYVHFLYICRLSQVANIEQKRYFKIQMIIYMRKVNNICLNQNVNAYICLLLLCETFVVFPHLTDSIISIVKEEYSMPHVS